MRGSERRVVGQDGGDARAGEQEDDTNAAAAPAQTSSRPTTSCAFAPGRADTCGEPLCTGVVYRVRDTAVEIAVDDTPDGSLEGNLRVERLANETSHRRLVQALDRDRASAVLGGGSGGSAGVGAGLVDVMFGNVPPRFHRTLNPDPKPWVNPGLDASQIDAVAHALGAADVALIHGPPGPVRPPRWWST